MTTRSDCILCRGENGDEELDVVEAWSDRLWRLTMARHGPTLGFGYLEPIRHIPYLADLDGEEAATFGPVIARASAALRPAPAWSTPSSMAVVCRTCTCTWHPMSPTAC
jgi:diadenosine tetraphosphate (Ap4A) HIT family hydrolase